MTGEQAKQRVLGVFAELRAEGFRLGTHWDEDFVVSIWREGDEAEWIDKWEANGEAEAT